MNKSEESSESLVYIAEDTESAYTLLKEYLEPFGIEIKRVNNGRELIDLIESHEPDLVFLDIKMPVMDGYETIKEIRKRKFKIPVVAQTAYAMSDEQTTILNAGFDEYMPKPLLYNKIIAILKKYLSIKALKDLP